MKYNRLSRRHFLEGVGGFTLALPFLPSLVGKAAAQGAPNQGLVLLAQPHGGLQGFYGPAADTRAGMSIQTLYSGHEVARRPIQDLVSNLGTETAISPVLGSFLNPYLNRMNLIRGLDVMFYLAHYGGHLLGNFVATHMENPALIGCPTLDWTLARPGGPLYGATVPVVRRVLINGWGESAMQALSYESPTTPATSTINMGWGQDTRDLFNVLFGGLTPTQGGGGSFVVDRVLEDFQRVTQSAYGLSTKMSTEDLQRLQGHIALLFDLQQRVNSTASCTPTPPTSPVSINIIGYSNYQTALNDMARMYALAFSCGVTRAWVQGILPLSNYSGDYHQDIAHNHANQQTELIRNYRKGAEGFAAFVRELNAIPNGLGGTLLDQAVVLYSHESGPTTHDTVELPMMMAGSGGGAFQTGQYLDFRNLNRVFTTTGPTTVYHGVPWNRFLGTIAQGFGLSPSSFPAYVNGGGYGQYYYEPAWGPIYAHQRADANTALPWLRA